ncbi:hypothetical protein [Trichocoleus sp. FACHB-262]
MLNAIFYQADKGTKWRNLPHDFPAITLRVCKKGKQSMATIACR